MSPSVKRWIGIVLLVGAWMYLNRQYAHLESNVEPAMFASGHQSRWWMILVLYWLADTAIFLCLGKIVARPFGLRMPSGFPYFQVGTDLAVFVFLMHLCFASTDRYVFAALVPVGLMILPQAFFLVLLAWFATALGRYRQLADIVRRLPSESRT